MDIMGHLPWTTIPTASFLLVSAAPAMLAYSWLAGQLWYLVNMVLLGIVEARRLRREGREGLEEAVRRAWPEDEERLQWLRERVGDLEGELARRGEGEGGEKGGAAMQS